MELGGILAIICGIGIIQGNRSWASIIFLFGILYCPAGAGFNVLSISLPPARFLIIVSLLRLKVRHEFPSSTASSDSFAIVFGAIMILSGIFHKNPIGAIVFRCSYAIDSVGAYFVLRSFIRTHEEMIRWFSYFLLLLIPIALEMVLWESRTGKNLFGNLGGLTGEATYRHGRLRAQGPFRHAITAGTVSATFIPITFALAVTQKNKKIAIVGLITLLLAIYACASSGPIVAFAAGIFGMLTWKFRSYLGEVRLAIVIMLVALHFIMKQPVWFLIARVNIVGGSTGWHRARLIDAAVQNFDEWWFAGTDYTRHWMPGASNMGWSSDHIDITNYFITCAVMGGFPLLIAFILLLRNCFAEIKFALDNTSGKQKSKDFLYWCMGVWLFANIISMISVSFYDQSIILFYAFIGIIASLGQFVHKRP